MTEVSFHYNVPDRMEHGCRLVRKLVNSGVKVVVTAEPGLLREFDRQLWTFAPLEFIPHAFSHDGTEAEALRAPVVLADSPANAPHQQTLVNLGGPVPEGFERFEKLIELVTVQEEDRLSARDRWKHYSTRGYSLVRHDLANRQARS